MGYTVPPPVLNIISNPLRSRDDAKRLLHDMLVPVYRGMSSGHGRVRLGFTGAHFDYVAAEMEGFCRPLWGLAPLVSVEPNVPEFSEMLAAWVDGLDNATNPAHEDYWGEPAITDQRYVELAAIAFAILIAPNSFWNPLKPQAKQRVADYLGFINLPQVVLPQNNWRFFRVLVNSALRSVNMEYPIDQLGKDFDFIETFYGEHDFPSDGPSEWCQAYDYYATSFAIPFYSILYAKFCGDVDLERAAKFRRRAAQNVDYLPHLFASNGNAIPFGRSMTYRFAVSSFWSALAFDGQKLQAPLSWGVLKGLILRNIRSFTQRESVFRRDGTLEIGWFYPNMFMSEDYNSPQSPYWALKAFLVLALPEEHPFWTANEEAYPQVWLEKPIQIVKPWSQVFSHAAGHTFCIAAGQSIKFTMRGAAAKYSKFAYSASFGFSLPAANFFLTTNAPDSVLALSDDTEGERWVVPRVVDSAHIEQHGVIKAEWHPWPDVAITTWLIPPSDNMCAYHVRIHRVVSPRNLKASDGGWAIHAHHKGSHVPKLDAIPDDKVEAGKVETANSGLLLSSAGVSGVVNLLKTSTAQVSVQSVDSGTNTNEARTALPLVLHNLPSGESWIATGVFGIPFDTDSGRIQWRKRWEELGKISGRTIEKLKSQFEIQ